jgi:hypothetical protein
MTIPAAAISRAKDAVYLRTFEAVKSVKTLYAVVDSQVS